MNGDQTEISWLEWGFKGIVAIMLAVFWWMWGKLVGAVAKNRERIDEVEKQVSDHTLEDSRLYIDKQTFRETVSEMKDTTKRIYEKMDSIFTLLTMNNHK